MSEYTEVKLDVLGGRGALSVKVRVCGVCGGVVFNTTKHDACHPEEPTEPERDAGWVRYVKNRWPYRMKRMPDSKSGTIRIARERLVLSALADDPEFDRWSSEADLILAPDEVRALTELMGR